MRLRWTLPALLATLVLLLGLAGSAASAAPAGGTKGSPQPELKHFSLGHNGAAGAGAMLSNGTAVLAWISLNDETLSVCRVRPGARSCASTAVLKHPQPSNDEMSFDDNPLVFTSGKSDVIVAAYACCSSNPASIFLYDSTNGGKTFGSPVSAGSGLNGMYTGARSGNELVVADSLNGSLEVQAFSLHPSRPTSSRATIPAGNDDFDTSLTADAGGVLVASDNSNNTYVEYAAGGSNFNKASSWQRVGEFKKQTATGVSGDALLTDPGGSLTGGERLRFYSDKKWSKAYKVPDSKAGDDGYFTLQKVHKTVHVFFEGRRDSYDVIAENTSNGSHWSKQHRYSTAITSTQLAPVLGSSGAGLVFEASSKPLYAQPILNGQRVSVKLARTRVTQGTSTKLTGQASPHLANHTVKLEELRGGRWYAVKSTHERSSGKFSFTVPGSTATYRAAVNDRPGYDEYGYSNKVTLTAVRG